MRLFVLTDQGSRLVDIEPMKDRKSSDIVKALQEIFKRKILKKPKVITTDMGTEFKKDFNIALEKMGIEHKTAQSGRHRSVALAERKNQTIGKQIAKVLLQIELSTGNASSQCCFIYKRISKIN
jgi:predicted Zn-dependent protease with MMP-like domain